jgi:hypothetical protein
MNLTRTVVGIALGATVCCFLAACSGAGGTDYGWFRYTPPEGWTKHEPSPGVTYAPTLAQFHPDVDDLEDVPRLEIREVTDAKSRTERVAALYAYARERDWRLRVSRAERDGVPPPAFESEEIASTIPGAGERQAYSFLIDRDTEQRRSLVHFVTMPDGRRFRIDYVGVDPGFTERRGAVTASLETLRFAASTSAQAAVSLEETVAELRQHLDGDRLWLYDGEVAGRRLNDEHLAALRDPTFANVADLNLISGHSATVAGVDVTDDGLVHLKHLPLRSLILRGSLVTDAGLAQLTDLPLEALVLAETLVEGDGLRHLSGLPLRILDLDGTRVGDASLQHLTRLPLISLDLRNTRVTEAGVARLQQQLPGVRINR